MKIEKFTYPFCYTARPEITQAVDSLIKRIDKDLPLKSMLSEGKMLGVLEVKDMNGHNEFIFAFSGLVGGKSKIDGFVPPIYDLTDPNGYFKRKEAEISSLNNQINSATDDEDIIKLKELRKRMSNELQEWIFDQYIVLNANGERKSIKQVFADRGLIPPGGTGDCAAPKLLNYAYLNGLKPIAMGEFWYGLSPLKEIRRHGSFYPSCTGKCGPLLSYMMEGLDVEPNPLDEDKEWLNMDGKATEPRIIYEDDDIIVVDKPSGMLSVPGRTGNKKSLQKWLQEQLNTEVFSCHRLDMDTSGLMVFAKSVENQSELQRQFSSREVKKTYIARLCATAEGKSLRKGFKGTISLPMMLDYYDRPRQMVDFELGKKAITEYEVIDILPGGEIDVRFTPLTGRTHQLRVHAAHPQGLGRPILGDRLYGGMSGASNRLCLHADSLSFKHPVSGEALTFSSSK